MSVASVTCVVVVGNAESSSMLNKSQWDKWQNAENVKQKCYSQGNKRMGFPLINKRQKDDTHSHLFSIFYVQARYGVRGLAIIQICLSKHPSLPHLQFNAHARVRDFVVGFYLRVFVATMRTTECRKNNFPEMRNLYTKIIKSCLKFRDSEFIGRHIRNLLKTQSPKQPCASNKNKKWFHVHTIRTGVR